MQQLYDIVLERARRFPRAIALGAQDGLGWRTLDSRTLLAHVDGAAEDLAGRGVRSGDRVVLWTPNGLRTPVYLFALWKLGAVAVPFDRDMNPTAAQAILASVEPRLVILGYDQRPRWAPEAGTVEWWEPSAPSISQPWHAPSEELAAIFFTSGTTGQPKGCTISHANLCSQVMAFASRIPLDEHCRLGSILPLSHLFELTCGLLYPLSRGAAIHYIPSRRGPDVVRVLADQHITHMMAVPQLLTLMGNALEQRLQARLPRPIYRALTGLAERAPPGIRRKLFFMVHRQIGGALRLMAAGGASLPLETQRQWERLGVDVVQGYGTSECSPVIACGSPRRTPAGSVGPPLDGVQVRLSAEGELQAKGPNVMRGYWHDRERTAEVLSEDGWYSTGDLARIDTHGDIWLQGRARDLIVLPSGMNVWPQDVEDALRAEPGVQDAAVLAVPTSGGGARLHGYLIPASAAARAHDPQLVLAHANARLAVHQRVASASWWPEADFPRTNTLKVRRHLLPLPTEDSTRGPHAPPPIEGDPVAEAVASVAKTTTVGDDQTLAELGIDSLGIVELVVQLEDKTGRALHEGALSTELRVAALREIVATAPLADERVAADLETAQPLPVPRWFYKYGWLARPVLTAPFDLLYAIGIPRTIVLGAEHLAGAQRGVVFAGNHRSFADLPLIRLGIGRSPARRFARRLVVAALAEGEGWRSPLSRYAAAAFGLYPLDRLRNREASLRRLADLARQGNAVLIFPQGTHARPSEERGDPPAVRFKTGVAHVAEALDAPVVPFGLAGTELAMPPFLDDFHGPIVAGVPVAIKRTTLAIAFGAPMRPEVNETAQDFTERLEKVSYELAALADRARGAT
ncbi:MAG TPA: AMP-binding protein [Chloroflexota bacterium]